MSFLDRFEKTAPSAGSTYVLIPEGEYEGQVTDVQIINGQTDTRIDVEFTLTKGEFTGRRVSWTAFMNEEASDKKLGFIKGTICRIVGTESTNGDTFGLLAASKGNHCSLTVKHKPGFKDPSKTFLEIYVNGVVAPF